MQREGDMPTYITRAKVRPTLRLGLRPSIFRTLARDRELRFFLRMSRNSLRVAGKYIDRLMNSA